MKTFKDAFGAEWRIWIAVGTARRLKTLSDPIDLFDAKTLQRVLDDLYSRFDLLWELVAEQAESIGVTKDEFDERLADGDAFFASCEALRAELENFFLRVGRPDLARILQRTHEAATRLQTIATEKIDSPKVLNAIENQMTRAESEIDQAIDKELAKLATPGTNSNASSDRSD